MNEIIEYLNQAKIKADIKSVNQLALKIGLPQSTMDAILKGKMIPSDEFCERIARFTGDRPEIIIALAHKSKAKGHIKEHWDKIIKALTAAAFVFALALPLTSAPGLCTLCQIV